MDKKKYTIDEEVFHDILQICLRFPNQEFDALPSDEEIVTFVKELRHKGGIKSVAEVVVDQIHQPLRTLQHSLIVSICENSIDTSGVFVSKKKAPPKAERNKGIELLSEAPSLEEAQLKNAIKRSKQETNIHQAGGSSKGADLESEVLDEPKGKSIDTSEGTGLKQGVPVVSKADSSKSEYESWGDSDNDDDHQSNDERTEFDNDKSADLNKTDDEEEDEFVHTPNDYVPTDDENLDDKENEHINKEMYDDVNMELKDAEPDNEEKGDEEMTHAENVNAEHEEVSQEVAGDQVKNDAQATVTDAPATRKTKFPLQCSSISSDYATKFLNFNNITSGEMEIISMMDIKVQHEDPRFRPHHFSPYLLRLSDLENEVKTLRNIDNSSDIHATIKSEVPTVVKEYLGTNLDDTLHIAPLKEFDQKRALFETITASKTFNKHPKHKALYHALMESILADEDAMDKGVADIQKKRKPDDADRDKDPPAGPDQGLKRRKTSKDTEQSKKAKSTGTSKGTTKSQPKSTSKSAQTEETVFEAGDTQVPQDLGEDMGNTDEPPVVKADPKDWFKKLERPPTPNPEGNEGKTVDNKPTQKWLSELAKAETSSKTFDDLMSTLIDFSAFVMNCLYPFDLSKPLPQVKSGNYQITKDAKYDLHGIKDMVPNLWSPIKVAYDKHALLVTNVKVNVWHGYGHLKEIEVRRSDHQLYKFMEGDFPRLHLNDIEDMLLLAVQNRLFNLKDKDIVHLAATLHPKGVIYEDKLNRKRLMLSDELYKFSDGTLLSVRDTLHDMATNLRMRKLMRSLEKFVGGRHYGEDLRLLQQTI
ncbi:hypothetical protein Tco_0157115 [Tanacetum coccineum]